MKGLDIFPAFSLILYSEHGFKMTKYLNTIGEDAFKVDYLNMNGVLLDFATIANPLFN